MFLYSCYSHDILSVRVCLCTRHLSWDADCLARDVWLYTRVINSWYTCKALDLSLTLLSKLLKKERERQTATLIYLFVCQQLKNQLAKLSCLCKWRRESRETLPNSIFKGYKNCSYSGWRVSRPADRSRWFCPFTLLSWDPTWSTVSSSGAPNIGRTWMCWSGSRGEPQRTSEGWGVSPMRTG